MFYGLLLLIIFVIVFVQHFTGKKEKAKIFLISNLILLFPMFYFLFNHLYIQYAIKNDKYHIEIDYIKELDSYTIRSKKSSNTSYSYYAILEKHNRVKLSEELYSSLNQNDSVYVVLIDGIFKQTYATSPIYPTKNYTYEY